MFSAQVGKGKGKSKGKGKGKGKSKGIRRWVFRGTKAGFIASVVPIPPVKKSLVLDAKNSVSLVYLDVNGVGRLDAIVVYAILVRDLAITRYSEFVRAFAQ